MQNSIIRLIIGLIPALGLCLILWGCEREDPVLSSPPETDLGGHLMAKELDEPPSAKPQISQEVPQNRVPIVEPIKLGPIPSFPGTRVKADVAASDEDGDPITLTYAWRRNGEIVAGEVFSELETTGFAKGDLLSVEVTPFDGKMKGRKVVSSPLLLHNSPPEITSFPPAGLQDGIFAYQVEATDPDNDQLTFILEGAPPDMVIDSETGRVEWRVNDDLKGDFQIRIIASDGDAKAYQAFRMSVGN